MAIINCPSCNAKMSSKAKACPNCGFLLKGLDGEELQQQQTRSLRKRRRGIEKQQMMAIIIFVVGCAGFFYASDGRQGDSASLVTWARALSPYLLSAGFLWYTVNRLRIYFKKF